MISVAMTTHNGEKYLRQQIDSILRQLSPEDEIVISDDGSTDNTIKIIEAYNSPNIRLLHWSTNLSLPLPERIGENFGNALAHCRGEYIFISDQDDIWLQRKVETMVEALQECDLVISNSLLLEKGCRCVRNFYNHRSPLRNYILVGKKYQGCCMALRAEALQRILPLPKRVALYDSYIGLVVELTGRVKYIAQPLLIHRIHTENTSKNMRNPLHYKISYRIRLLSDIYRIVIRHHIEHLKFSKPWRA